MIIEPDIEKYYKQIYEKVAGVDEAGRGALAGPVVAAAVILPKDCTLEEFGLTDSKKINEKKREELYEVIHNHAIAIAVGIVHNEDIDKINILKATLTAMNEAIRKLEPQPDFLIIDGNYFNGSTIKFNTIVKGDLLCPSISAASVIAKVTRDRWMSEVADVEFPNYGFSVHKGYAVKAHYDSIDKIGTCKYHRKTFLNKHNNTLENKLF